MILAATGLVLYLQLQKATIKLLTPTDNLLNEATLETIKFVFFFNVFKLPQETLVKTVVENYRKK